MNTLIAVLVAAVAALHLYFLWLEMFGWTSRGPKVFKNIPAATFTASKALAANQGLYNGFLAAGLIWSLLIPSAQWSRNVATFFLGCAVIAGVYGALTVERKIAAVQAAPALVTLLILLIH